AGVPEAGVPEAGVPEAGVPEAGVPEAVPAFAYATTPVLAGRTLVEASAGTGKTFAIAGLVLRLVLDPEAGGDDAPDWLAGEEPAPAKAGGRPDLRRLLVVTFTNAATDELRTRIRAALRTALAVARGAEADDLTRPLADLLARAGAEDRLLAALDRVDEAAVTTIHGFCKRVLDEAAFESGTPFEMEFVEDGDSDALRTRAAADAWARLAHGDPLLTALALDRGLTPDALRQHHAAVADFPHVEILPAEPVFDDALAALRDAQARLGEAWDADAMAERLVDLDWNKSAALGADPASVCARVEAFAAGDADALPAVALCAPEAVAKAATTRSTAQKDAVAEVVALDAIQSCGAVAAAADLAAASFTRAFVLEVDARIRAIKERRGQLTFGDLITKLHDALHDPDTGPTLAARIRQQFGVALVDEFQDTDPLQYAIFKTAFAGRPLVFVGDPKQAIYAFRGADVHAYLRAQAEADRVFTLGTNWRSTAGLVEAVNAVFAAPRRAFLFDPIPFRPVASSPAKAAPRLADGDRPPLVWWPLPEAYDGRPLSKTAASREIPALVAAEIQRLLREARLGDRRLGAGDIAVLVPTRFVAGDVLRALQAAGVPAVVSRANDVRESVVMGEVELLLRAVLRPHDERALRAALATELWGWSAHAVAALDEAPDRQAQVAQGLRDAQRTWRRSGVLGVLVDFQEREGVLERMLALPDGERRVTDLRHTAELLHEIERAGARSPDDLLHWLHHRHEQALPSREMKELRLERDAEAVTITTHHNAKGLEFEVVFVPYLWSLSERDLTAQKPALARTPDGVVYDLGSDRLAEHDRLRQADALAESVRRAYVALTRARERCYVVGGRVTIRRRRLDAASPLGYLLHGHQAPYDGSLTDHAFEARAAASVERPLDVIHALDPTGRLMRVVEPPAPASGPMAVDDEAGEEAETFATALPEGARDRVRSPWTRASFTAWTSGHSGGLAASDEPLAPEAARPEAEPAGLHAFAAGAAPGTCLHEILQYAKWGDDAEAAEINRETVARRLQQHGLDRVRRHRVRIDPPAEALALIERVATAPLLGETCLRDVKAEALAAEWDFTVPLAPVAPDALAEAFRQHGAAPFGAAYADDLARLSSAAVDGYLTGSADLVAYADDRWWVADWKSNRLGADAAAYTPDALEAAMLEHHYGLQLHLYTLGLHRFLRSRLGAAYAYETHVGGAVYAFLRGMDGREGAGLFRHRPLAALVDALDRLLTPDG
ncbi:MAG: UvrD-helicase domain-containing protein, partial [Bacteroidota bacterium]